MLPSPAFRASATALTAEIRARMSGVSWRPGCPVSLGQLRLLRLSYWGFDNAVHTGELIVNTSAAAAVTRAFAMLFASRLPIRRMQVVDDFGGDDERVTPGPVGKGTRFRSTVRQIWASLRRHLEETSPAAQ